MNKSLQSILITVIILLTLNTKAQTFGKAVKLNGSTEYLTVPNGTNSLESNTLTFECWSKRTSSLSVNGKDRIFMAINSGGWGVLIETNKVKFTKVGVTEVVSGGSIADTNWHHIAVSYNGAVVKFYIDGLFDSQANLNTTFSSTGAYSIGSRGTGEFYGGKLDDIRVWNVVRSATEISTNYCMELLGSETGLIRYYKLNEGTGTTIADAGPNAVTGSITVGNSIWVNSNVTCVTGLTEREINTKFTIYPNPTVDFIVLESNNLPDQTNYFIMDYSGKEIQKGLIGIKSNQINISQLPKGLYFIKLNNFAVTKFIKN